MLYISTIPTMRTTEHVWHGWTCMSDGAGIAFFHRFSLHPSHSSPLAFSSSYYWGKIYFVMFLVLVKWSMFCKYKVFNTTVCIFRCRQSSDQIQALQWSAIKSLIQVLIKCSKPGLHNSWCWRSLKQNDAQIVTEESRQQLNYWPE